MVRRRSGTLPLPGVQFPPDLILSARTLRHTRSHSLRHCRPCRIAHHRPQTPHLQDWCRWMSRPESLAGSKRIPSHYRPKVRRGSEEHTSELQSLRHLVCRLLLEKKKKSTKITK